jgi:protein-arginine kinase activator protein McsA
MENANVTDKDREMAQVCMNCPMWKNARKDQDGWMNACVKNFVESICPFFQVYERVYGRKAHGPVEEQ